MKFFASFAKQSVAIPDVYASIPLGIATFCFAEFAKNPLGIVTFAFGKLTMTKK